MVTVCPSQFATRRTLFHVLVGCGLLMLKVSRLKLPVIWLRSEERRVGKECRVRWLQKTAYEIGLGIPAEPLFRSGSVDPNFGRRVRNRRQLNSLQNTWPYGYSMPIAVRYTQDAFSRSGWLWPVDAKGEPLKATSYMAVGFYVAKYV